MDERVQAVMETGTDPFPLTEADQAELKLTKMLYPFPNRRLKVPVSDRSFVGVAAVRMTAATVLRMVLLRKAVDAAQGSDYVRLTHAFNGWCRFTQYTVVGRKEYHMHLLMYARDVATRQWISNWCGAVQEAAKKITGAETLEGVVVRLMIRGATRQWISNWCGAVQKAEVAETARVEANKEKCKCYEDMQGLVMCKKCRAPMSEHEFNRILKAYDGYVKLS